MPSKPQKFDVHQEITNRIAEAIETAGEFQLPWIRSGGGLTRPVNVASKNTYNGVNILSLWISAIQSEYPSNLWGTYRQWQEKGCQVRKGEKGSLVVFYKRYTVEAAGDDENDDGERLVARASWVFNAAQVEGFSIETPDIPEAAVFDPLARAEAFAQATGAVIQETGDSACYLPGDDLIRLPERRRFTGTDTMSAGESFYAVLCHELVHWSGAKSRLDRNLAPRFGSEAYAMEELVAELGSAFLCAELGITPEPRTDHACYIKTWLEVLKNDNKAIFSAASKASEAANWLIAHEVEAGA
ncbi:ArdC family protein [Jiella marina]|uniref:ArdC family protein n=1 Tax=Jiella sp. LLJ827 TaxID=2917712 RepID=UPI00210122F2|nr:zincin-like metallopeptidase domain-containing protein [Jiella sp. LLJ827]MCQ0990342.1 zincin-like metallopeptidase domain-containing protein [Jiella sp. LLJ827]